MLIVCPSCASEYALDPARLGPAGRRVRCAACRESWAVLAPLPPEDEPAAHPEDSTERRGRTPVEAPATTLAVPAEPDLCDMWPIEGYGDERAVTVIEPDDPGPPKAAVARRRRPVGRGKTAGRSWPTGPRLAVGAVLLVLLAVPALLAGRASLVRVVPQSAVLFSAVGLPVNLVGLRFVEVSSELGRAGDKPELSISGQIVNTTRRAQVVPPLEIAIRGEDGTALYNWSIAARDARLEAGETTPFRARLASPPPAGRAVVVTFRTGSDAAVVATR